VLCLPQASFDFCEATAQSYGGVPQPSSSGGGSSAEASGADPPAEAPAIEFVRIEPQPESFTFTEVPSDAGKTFEVDIGWLQPFYPGATCRFDTIPGRADGLTFQLPDAVATAVRIRAVVDASAVSGTSFTVHSLFMQRAPAQSVDPPERQPVPSRILPPKDVSETEGKLSALGWRLGSAPQNGDCAPLSISAGCEITPAQAANPSVATTEAIRILRNDAVQIVAGTGDIAAGIPASVFREGEGLSRATGIAQRAFKAWRKSFHWRGKGSASAAFLFGCSVRVHRQVAVLAISEDGAAYQNPARVYGLRDGAQLRRTPAKGGSPETIQSWMGVPIDTLLESLRSHPEAYSLVKYNGSSHFDPFLYDSCTAAPGEVATEVVAAADLGAMSDVDDEDAPAAAASMPTGSVAPGQANATLADSGQEAERQSVRMTHVEAGFSGLVQPPATAEGTLAASIAQSLAMSHDELPGDPAVAEVASLAPTTVQELTLAGLTDEQNEERLAALGCRWKDAEQTTLLGTMHTYEHADSLSILLVEMGVDDVAVLCPGLNMTFSRSNYGRRQMSYTVLRDPAVVGADPDETQPPGDFSLGNAEGSEGAIEMEESPELDCGFGDGMGHDAGSEVGEAEIIAAVVEPVEMAAEASQAQLQPPPSVRPTVLAQSSGVSGVQVVAVQSSMPQPAAVYVVHSSSSAVAVATVAPSKRAQRGAAKRAIAALQAEEEIPEEDSPAQVKHAKVAVAVAATEASLQEALSGKFARFQPVAQPPPWLSDAVEPDSDTATRLHACIMVFNCMRPSAQHKSPPPPLSKRWPAVMLLKLHSLHRRPLL
jgi:hypothetical protein